MKTCLWKSHFLGWQKETSCGHNVSWELTRKGFIYCPYCGKRISQELDLEKLDEIYGKESEL